ncbi:hypothetical protein G5714_008944 [Onychostoma macrolepis]|uniref:Uncharacterized protein n=1 Tax=Onychostoma macrolepis TaxID=369639 RepID=A0A7J6CVG0_9TELE|nr:hypothetical protein G5714_008944 [Onychostoma macrolepis]
MYIIIPQCWLRLSPSKSPAAKKKASDIVNVNVSSQLDNITQLINCRSDTIEQKISDLNEKVDAVTSELKSVAAKLDNITQLINCRSDTIEQKISDLNEKVDAVTSELKSVAAKVMSLERRVDQVEQPIRCKEEWMI